MFKSFITFIKNFAVFIEKKAASVFKRFGKDATGKTIQSLRSAVEFDLSKQAEIDLYGAKWIEYINDGRPAGGKMPPQGVLVDWLRARGIALAAEFPIRMAIAENGILPTPVIETTFIEVQKSFFRATPKLLTSIAKGIASALKKGFKID